MKSIKENGLNDRQLRFCKEYVVDLNGTQAAIRVGYSKKAACEQASRLLGEANIKAEISKLQEKVSEKTKTTAAWVINNLREVVERCMQKTPVMVYDREERCKVQVEDEEGNGVWQFDSAGANRALELIGKHVGAFPDKLQVDLKQDYGVIVLPAKRPAGSPVPSDEEIKANKIDLQALNGVTDGN